MLNIKAEYTKWWHADINSVVEIRLNDKYRVA